MLVPSKSTDISLKQGLKQQQAEWGEGAAALPWRNRGIWNTISICKCCERKALCIFLQHLSVKWCVSALFDLARKNAKPHKRTHPHTHTLTGTHRPTHTATHGAGVRQHEICKLWQSWSGKQTGQIHTELHTHTYTQAKEIHVHARAYVCACDLQEKTLIRHVERETVASFINLCGLRCLARTLQTQFGI